MARPFSKRIVVDASVARAAGGPATLSGNPEPLPNDPERGKLTSRRCRKAMTLILKICHRLVWTKEIAAEWDNHQSEFSRRWRVAMAQKGKLIAMEVETDERLRDGIEEAAEREAHRYEMQKDRLLLEAALAADEIVLSINEKDRRRFAGVCDEISHIRTIVWVNPDRPADDCETWLNAGARPDSHLRLTNYDG